ncbi:outer dense fiber protein 3B isoform X2 [Monomorium pharaonis]|uniref:outer dense fiber protein 3B isoform X2 n=1 Tax=Monomorium pharaonis TaxID=307658 RepID=UPI0017463AF4|nr:outer dense fiber protein 3B isoform X2 [Monomorium pharaonis]
MPPKKERKRRKDADKSRKKTLEKKESIICHFITPGPKYQLKTLIGYKNHCISKYQNPAYTFGRHFVFEVVKTPGPKYVIKGHRLEGFTFGHALKHRDIVVGPGPKYMLPNVRCGPFFSIKWRGLRTAAGKRITSAGFHYSYNLNAVKPKAPMYTIASRAAYQFPNISDSPGPIYAVLSPKPIPAFSFGVKHSKCAPPYITKCDEQC